MLRKILSGIAGCRVARASRVLVSASSPKQSLKVREAGMVSPTRERRALPWQRMLSRKDSRWQSRSRLVPYGLMLVRGRTALLLLPIVAGALIGGEPAKLGPDQMAKAARTDTITIPTPGELFAALQKPGKPNWTGAYRAPIPTTYKNRAQLALNLGGLIADGFIAVEAQDSQQVKNIGSDVIKLAKALGVSQNILGRSNSINDFAETNQWGSLQEELEATQNEVKNSMQSHSDQDLVILVSIGGWIRGTQVVSGSVAANYDERSAKLLRQPALVGFIHAKLNDVSPDLRNDPLVKNVNDQLTNLEKLVTFPTGKSPSPDDVRKVNSVVSDLIQQIQHKPEVK